MEAYETLSEAMAALKIQGYTIDFNLKQSCIQCSNDRYTLAPDEFKIDKSFRFDVNEDPSDQSVLYAISSEKHHIKGLLVGGYGIYSDSITNELLEKLK
ncbi:MAG: phosphoribosylpyrophosphate synthetase [Bacteroidetes bacterium]|nr:phosphoribosylpyrophosphate synthetase [Bacteroidota bacterium]